MIVKPLNKNILVKLNIEEETKSGIKIVRKKQEWEEETVVAEVMAIGDNVENKTQLTPGAFVVIAGHAGKWIDPSLFPSEPVTHRMIDEDDVIGIIESSQEDLQEATNG